MLKLFRENIDKVIGVATAIAAVTGFVYAKLPWHATSVVMLCLVLAMFLLFFPWRFPTWSKESDSKPDDDFYPVMKWLWLGGIALAVFVGLGWPTTNFLWVKSPDILAARMQEAHLDIEQDQKMAREGVWDAKLAQTNLPAPEILVGLPPLDQNRRPQTSEVRHCVPAIQALRTAFGELSSYSMEIRLAMILAIGGALGLVVAERLHEATRKAHSKRRVAATRKS
jgi:hypothetical protein